MYKSKSQTFVTSNYYMMDKEKTANILQIMLTHTLIPVLNQFYLLSLTTKLWTRCCTTIQNKEYKLYSALRKDHSIIC